MPSTHTAYWYANPDARRWQTAAPASALAFHRTLAGYSATPLTELPALAAELGVGRVFLTDGSNRLSLPAFKILGASWAVCRALCERHGLDMGAERCRALSGGLERDPGLAGESFPFGALRSVRVGCQVVARLRPRELLGA